VDDDPPAQTIEEPNDAEREWIAGTLLSAADIVRSYVDDDVGWAPSDLALLDSVFASWLEDWLQPPESERVDPNPFINAFGIALGQALVDGLGLEWKVVTDSDGTEMAVHGDSYDFLVFPPNLVAKRFVAQETMFLEPIYDEIARMLSDARKGRFPS